jgi:antibiotic biosynthesis monooxygenase (ABM) superfamily enzyme
MTERPDHRAAARRWPARLATTLAAWIAAFLIVMALLSVLRDELASLPLAIRALVISGVVVTAMTTVVMPVLSVAVGRWLTDSTRERSPTAARRTGRG